MSNHYYRFEFAGYGLRVDKYHVIKETEKGVWVGWECEKHFILHSSRKKFAYPTKMEALIGFRKRKRRELEILRDRIEKSEKALWLAESYVCE